MKYWKSMAAGAAVIITPITAFAGDSMQLGERLQAGQALTSPNGTFSAKMGNDCQFGVYAKMANPNLPPRALWTSKSKNKGQGCYLELQKVNGHLVVFDKNRSGKWSAGLYKKPPGNRKLTLDNSGDLILRENGKKIWSTKTASAPTGSSSAKKNSLYMGSSLKGGESLVTRDGAYKAVMHKNCNFVLYKTQGNQTLWSTKTANRGKNCRLDLQKKDGNLVIYDGPKKVIWATNKYSAFPGSRNLTISGSGNMAVQKGSEIIWQTHTAQNGRARSVGAVTLPGKGAYLKQISDGKVKAWVWQKSSGDQHLFYENSRTDTEIALQEANVRFKASINL